MISFVVAIQAQNPFSWLLSNWAMLLGLVVVIVFFYVFTAVMLDLPLPFEAKKSEGEPKDPGPKA